ncbi:hypothetical protein ACWDG1_46405 [Streptomyces sp. NPDC001177]
MVTGSLAYMAPGKLLVGGRPFLLTENTKIRGVGGICGDVQRNVVKECTVEEAEAAAKTGKVKAEVDIRKGTAVEIREQ